MRGVSFATEFDSLAKLLRAAASQIAAGVEGSFADEEEQHPMATQMRRVERQCQRKASELEAAATFMRAHRRREHGNRSRMVARVKREQGRA